MMDSSFLTWAYVGLGLYSAILFLKLIIQFGVPNHPARFITYLVTFCATFYFCSEAAVGLGFMTPWFWMKWRTLPIVAGSLALLLQTIMMVGKFSLIQQKVVSRLPLMAGLLFFAFFPAYAEFFFGLSVLIGALFLIVSVRKARLQKRHFLKMVIFLGLFGLCQLPQGHWAQLIGQVLLFFALFYFFLFEHTFGVSALLDEFQTPREGATR